MLREGLGAEFPGISRVARVRIDVSREAAPLGALAGLGAWLVAGIVAHELLKWTWLFLLAPAFVSRPPIESMATVAAVAAGAAVGARAGGPRAVGLFVAYLVVTLVVAEVRITETRDLTCRQLGFDACPLDGVAGITLRAWPTAMGLAVSWLLARAIRVKPGGRNALLLAAGAVPLGALVTTLIPWPPRPYDGDPFSPQLIGVVATQAAAAFVAGTLVARRSMRPWTHALLLAALVVVPWLPVGWGQLEAVSRSALSAGQMWPFFTPFYQAAAIFLGLAAERSRRRNA